MQNQAFRLRLIRQALLHKKARAILIVLAVVMGSSVVTALWNLNKDLRERMNVELRDYGPNVVITAASTPPGTDLDARDAAPFLKGTAGVRVLAGTAELFVPVTVEGERALLVGADMQALRKLYPGWSMQGTGRHAVLGRRLARRIGGGAAPARQVSIQAGARGVRLPVSGVLESGEAEDDEVFVSLAAAQELAGKPGKVQVVLLSVIGSLPAVQARYDELARGVPGTRAEVQRKIAAAETDVLDKLSRLMALVIAFIFAILFFCIYTTVTAILLARQSEIALLRVLGARRRQILFGFTLELLTLSVAGGLLGYLVGLFMAQVLGRLLFQSWITPRLSVLAVTMIASVLMTLVSAFLPIRRAVNRQAAVVLKES